ncbi:hypothetical protein ACLOJK_017687 [Asimina triloba]
MTGSNQSAPSSQSDWCPSTQLPTSMPSSMASSAYRLPAPGSSPGPVRSPRSATASDARRREPSNTSSIHLLVNAQRTSSISFRSPRFIRLIRPEAPVDDQQRFVRLCGIIIVGCFKPLCISVLPDLSTLAAETRLATTTNSGIKKPIWVTIQDSLDLRSDRRKSKAHLAGSHLPHPQKSPASSSYAAPVVPGSERREEDTNRSKSPARRSPAPGKETTTYLFIAAVFASSSSVKNCIG